MTQPPFEQVLAEHGAVVLRVCRTLLGPSDAEDAWSETFLAALRAYPELRADSNVRGWLVTIAYHKAIDQLRERSRARPSGTVPDPIWNDRHAVDHEDMRGALESLPPKQRGAVMYRYLADLPYAEVGRLLDTSEAAARRSAADGIAALRKRLAGKESA